MKLGDTLIKYGITRINIHITEEMQLFHLYIDKETDDSTVNELVHLFGGDKWILTPPDRYNDIYDSEDTFQPGSLLLTIRVPKEKVEKKVLDV